MAKKKAREDEIEAAPLPSPPIVKRRRTRGATSTAAPGIMCNDVLRGIFARLPARTAIASMALSKHHRRLIRCPDFVTLHCRLAPPLPHPHIAYVATAKLWRSGGGGGKRDPVPVSGYHGFHVAGGAGLGSSNARMRSLAGPMHLDRRYVNTCNGVVLLAGGKATPTTTTCVLWNPAVADEERKVSVPVPGRDDCAILGLGYGPRSKTYKLLLTRRQKMRDVLERDPPIDRLPKELLVYPLGGGGGGGGGGAGEQPLLRTLLSERWLDGEISSKSLYIDGTIYLLHFGKSVILAFDVDDETVTTIDLPGDRDRDHPWKRHAMSGLLVMSGRPCVDVNDKVGRALWLLTVDHQWERRCIFSDWPDYNIHSNSYSSIAGVWDCDGMLAIYMDGGDRRADGKLFLYCTATEEQKMVKLPWSLSPKWPDYAFCWGYKPTLVSPGSIVGELSQDEERRRDRRADIMAALEPVTERDRRKGLEATLDTVCFMEFLFRIMHKLPENMQDVIDMPLLKSEDSYSNFNSELYHSDSCSTDEDEIYHSDSEPVGLMIKPPVAYLNLFESTSSESVTPRK